MSLRKIKTFSAGINTRGSLLIEALLIVVILSVSLTLIIRSLLSSLSAAVYHAEFSQVALLLENKMNHIIAAEQLNQPLEEEIGISSGKKYRYTLEQRDVSEEGADDFIVKEIRLGITWHSGRKDNTLFLTTYLFPSYENER